MWPLCNRSYWKDICLSGQPSSHGRNFTWDSSPRMVHRHRGTFEHLHFNKTPRKWIRNNTRKRQPGPENESSSIILPNFNRFDVNNLGLDPVTKRKKRIDEQLKEHPFSLYSGVFEDNLCIVKFSHIQTEERELCHSHGNERAGWRTVKQIRASCQKVLRVVT